MKATRHAGASSQALRGRADLAPLPPGNVSTLPSVLILSAALSSKFYDFNWTSCSHAALGLCVQSLLVSKLIKFKEIN